MRPLVRFRRRLGREEGFTMLFALLALFVGSLLVAAAFTAANGDVKLTKRTTMQTKAYYAALAGIQAYHYHLNSEPNFWIKCPETSKALPVPEATEGTAEPTEETYTYKTLHSSTSSTCESGKQTTALETIGNARGTFRVLAVGIAGEGTKQEVKRSIVATFAHPGFTKYVYESNFEVEDPSTFEPEPTECAVYYKERVKLGLTKKCPAIQFASEDKVNGPMHTNDAAAVCKSGTKEPTFGRSGQSPPDSIEMNQGHYAAGGCENSFKNNGTYTESAGTLLPPATDSELLEAAGKKFTGRTVIELKSGSPNTMKWTNGGTTKTESFPANGVIFVANSSSGCAVGKYTPFGSDTVNDTGCGDVYVSGAYTESLTIASEDDVIVNGNLTTTSETNGEPTGGATLGLIAENFVRVYHPVETTYALSAANYYTPNTEAPKPAERCTKTVELSGKRTLNSSEITNLSSTSSLAEGAEVSGSGIPTGTTIKSIKNSTTVVLTQKASSSGTSTVTFVVETGYKYFKGINKCVEAPKSGYTFAEAEVLDTKCNTNGNRETEKYAGKKECYFTNNSEECDAENLGAAEDPNKWGSLKDPTIDAAILSTKHSWIVDNYECGEKLGTLNVWGSIAQYWRGPVGQAGGSGYLKNYNYDERLASQQPPSFLSPSTTSWKLSRETAPPTGFTG